jgi:hypothetical protein
MNRGHNSGRPGAANQASWLEALNGDAPILLIAPHGGRAGPASRATLHPKVNDLHTADITRELCERLGAAAIINAGMDRNRLDLNRLSQVMRETPWILEMILERLEDIIARHRRAVVLLIHGWNVIEPRVDLGVGLKSADGALRPARGAHVSASDAFINETLIEFTERLRQGGIKPSFGLRYPGGGADNLLQAFSQRHAMSPDSTLRRLASFSARGALEAVQLELSVALRLPGRLRAEALDAIAGSFSPRRQLSVASATRISIQRADGLAASGGPRRARQNTPGPPMRIGLEFYDPAAMVGAMVSFDLGPAAAGARVMALIGRERIALFTAEGRVDRTPDALALGPLKLIVQGPRLAFEFRGPAVVVEDGTSYLSVERALSRGSLHDRMELRAEFAPWQSALADARPADLLDQIMNPELSAQAIFGRVTARLSMGGMERDLEAVARAGRSFTGLGGGSFCTRRMIWAAFPDGGAPHAIEAREIQRDGGVENAAARILSGGRWADGIARRLKLEPLAPSRPPERISALLEPANGADLAIGGEMRSFMMLSRPGPAQSRILTSLGFAAFVLGEHVGAGMFEYSERIAEAPGASAAAEEAEDD